MPAPGPLPVAPLNPPVAQEPPALPRPARAADSASAPAVQRLPGFSSGHSPGRTVGALAAAASATVASHLERLWTPPRQTPPTGPPPPYEPPAQPAHPPGGPPPYEPPVREADPPPEYTAVPAGGFDPRDLTDFQLDELVHRITGRVTRLVRTELRMDRERVGRLRDPRA